ncbi:hypothetical protein ACFQ1B_01670 [Streptomyces mexicanus]
MAARPLREAAQQRHPERRPRRRSRGRHFLMEDAPERVVHEVLDWLRTPPR